MTDNEKEEHNATMDKMKRENIIEEALLIAFSGDSIILEEINNIKEFYKENYKKYLSRYVDITSAPYSFGDFWFNDAGFQFNWKNHCCNIQLECIPWNEVKRRIKKNK